MPAERLDANPWAAVADFVARKFGLQFPGARWPDLARGVAACARELGEANAHPLAARLASHQCSEAEVRALARHLTVGETYFFRDPAQIAALSSRVLPALIAGRGEERRLRIWSAGCASGEEPYTVAMLLDRLLPDRHDWDIGIIATDLNPFALRKAEAGEYGEWSFRNAPPGLKERYFRRLPDGRHALVEPIRRMVRFAQHNLAQGEFPPPECGGAALDLILCRNVLMYFGPAQRRHVVEGFQRSLRADGWLAVSPSETSQELYAPLVLAPPIAASIYRKAPAGEPARTAPLHAPLRKPRRPTFTSMPVKRSAPALQPLAGADATLAPTGHAEPALSPAAHAEAALAPAAAQGSPRELARALADRGELAQALQWSRRWIESDKLDPAAHYLHAMIQLEAGELGGARAALRRACFLDPGFVLAHYMLGLVARREGAAAEARRQFRHARKLLERCAPEALLREGEGLSAAHLAATLDAQLSSEEADHG